MDSELWDNERSLWTGGPEAYRACVDDGAIMAFPGLGFLSGAETILAAIEGAPRWPDVAFTAQTLALAETDGLAVLAYEARAQRPGEPEYHVFCTSTWVRRDAGWAVVQHQQTLAG